MECKFCKKEMTVRNFVTKSVYYCEVCYDYRQEYIACDHEMRYFLFKLENESRQLTSVCIRCYYRDPRIIKQTPELLSMAADKLEVNYTKNKSDREREEAPEINEFIKGLRVEQEKVRKNNYQAYINSDRWKELRKIILVRDKYICQICGKKATDVHHLNYAHFMEELDFELVSLCGECHIEEYHTELKKKFVEQIMYQKAIMESINRK